MSHQVALAFEDGVTRFVACEDGQTVADASYRARINIPLDCRDGACGTCKARCESGEYDGGTYIEDALTAAEAEQGYCLPCSMTPRTDLVLQIASTSAVARTAAATHATTVTAIERLSPTTVRLSLAAPTGGRPLSFLPGQYVNLSVPGSGQARSYSFSNEPGADRLEFLVKLVDGGLMSSWLTGGAAVGDEVSFTGPHGSFFLREADRPALLLAGGTGLAPVLSILRRLAREGSERTLHLVYGVSTDDDVVELDTLRALAERLPHLTWDHCVSDPASTAASTGYVMSLIGDEHLHGGDVAVYLCGPPPMVEAVREHFSSRGVTPTGFYYEKFTPSSTTSTTPPAPDRPQEVERAVPAQAPVRVAAEVAPEPVVEDVDRPSQRSLQPARSSGRAMGGRTVFPAAALPPLGTAAAPRGADDPGLLRRVAGQVVFPSRLSGEAVALDAPVALLPDPSARSVAGQRVWGEVDLEPLVCRPVTPPAPPAEPLAPAVDGYEIGEEHPGVHESDALFEARRALELGALELVLGTLSSQQLSGYRLLAELTLPYVDGDRFVDAAAYTETNAAFHDHLFTLTGNEHLLQAYQALGVQGRMAETLREATWCDPRCATDHVEIVDAIEAQDRVAARRLVTEHAERSKTTMRRAMAQTAARRRPAFVSPGRFAGQVVVVTGAAQGIGEASARRIGAEGGTLVLADRSGLVQELAAELRRDDACGGASAVEADLETYDGARAVVEAALAAHGRVDVAIHTVGGTIWAKPYTAYPPEQVEAEIRRSLFPTLWGCRAVAPHMAERGSGTIVNVSSVATRGVHRVPYSAAKGGVNAVTASLALELAPYGVRVVATAPGGTDAPPRRVPRGPAPQTEQERAWYQGVVDQTVESSLLKRYGTLHEQAAAICFLASREASYVTGTTLPVAGGDLG